MLEKDIENLIAMYPDEFFPGEGFHLLGQQIIIDGRRLDILFEDKYKRKIIVEVKRGILTRESSGQVAEYYGLLKSANEAEMYELVLCANVIPAERRIFLETIGISCVEVGVVQIADLAKRHDYRFADDQSAVSGSEPRGSWRRAMQVSASVRPHPAIDDGEPTVWIFQGNPSRYDILNSLSDAEIGNRIHWQVNQNVTRIHKGHLVLLWMSGRDSGIYALGRVECEPSMMEESVAEKKYWFEESSSGTGLRVEVSILRRFINGPLLKMTLKAVPGLAQLSIFRQPQGTNFPVRDSEWEIISELM